MRERDLRSFTARTRSLLETAPPTSLSETQTLIVDPLLDVLGWHPHGERCRRDLEIEGVSVEYCCSVASTPALYVLVEPYETPLDTHRLQRLERCMGLTGVDRAIYTNARDVVLLAGLDAPEVSSHSIEALPEATAALEHVSSEACERRLETRSTHRAARRLALDRSSLVTSITDELGAVAGHEHERTLETLCEEFLTRVITTLATAEATNGAESTSEQPYRRIQPTDLDTQANADVLRAGQTPTQPDRPDTTQTASAVSEPRDGERNGSEAVSSSSVAESDRLQTDAYEETPDDDSDVGEYVARFFTDRGSVGAVGESTSERAMVSVTEYLFERGLTGVRTPWQPDDDDDVVLAEEPTSQDGTRMERFKRLSNGLYLNTSGDAEVRAARVVALATRSGLRVMLTGDWTDTMDE